MFHLFINLSFLNCKADAVLTTDEMLDNIAWMYAQFSLTFDPAMIATPSTQHPIASTSQAAQINRCASLLPSFRSSA